MRGTRIWLKGLAIVAGSFLGFSAHAGMTGIGKTPVLEAGHEGVFEHQYGGDWHKVGDDFYNGSMSAKRMDDFLSVPSVLNVGTGSCGYSTDQTWCGNKFVVNAVAKFSGNTQGLSMVDSSGHHSLMNVTGFGFNIDPASVMVDDHGKNFTWERSEGAGVQSSMDGSNADHRDHLLTYLVDGLPGVSGPVWMLFFEDMDKLATTPKNRTYADYNDLVVEVRSVAQSVPLPPAGWAGLFTLSGAAVVRGRKLISKAVTA